MDDVYAAVKRGWRSHIKGGLKALFARVPTVPTSAIAGFSRPFDSGTSQ